MKMNEAIEAVYEAAGPIWQAKALEAIRSVASQQPTVHADDVVAIFPDDPPCDRRAWGGVWRRAVKQGYVERTGEFRHNTLAATLNENCHPGFTRPVYRSLIFQAA